MCRPKCKEYEVKIAKVLELNIEGTWEVEAEGRLR